MDVFATRTLTYTPDHGDDSEIVLCIFKPFQTTDGHWKCHFSFDPPIYQATARGGGVDFLHTLLVSLRMARTFLESTVFHGRTQWQGMQDCGLPSSTDQPTSSDARCQVNVEDDENGATKPVLATRTLGYPDENGIEREVPLTVFEPFATKRGYWKCEFALEPILHASGQYGVGADCIEAFLDALAKARAAYENALPPTWKGSDDLLDCADLPIKIGRSFHIRRAQTP